MLSSGEAAPSDMSSETDLQRWLAARGQRYTVEELATMRTVYASNMGAMRRYVPRAPAPAGLELFRAQTLRYEFLPGAAESAEDPAWGWGALSDAPLPVQLLPGDHFSMVRGDAAQVLAQTLRRSITDALREEDA